MPVRIINASRITNDLAYTNWVWVPFLHNEVLEGINSVPYSEIPANLLPTTKSQTAFETGTCSLIAPWGGFGDPFSEFFLGGGTTGTVLGALNGLNIVEQSFLQKANARYGLGQEYIGPELGYCVNTLFKEKVYTLVEARNLLNFNSLITTILEPNQFGSSKEQLIWRSKFERFYLNHGKIQSIEEKPSFSGKKYTITIDTKSETTAVGKVDFTSIPDTIKLTKQSDGKSLTFDVNEVRGINGGIEIDVEVSSAFSGPTAKAEDFKSGDYFELSKSWLIQDPYMMDGLMREIIEQTIISGTQEFFRTDQNTSFLEGSITGVYIRRRNLAVGDEVKVRGVDAIVTKTYTSDPSLPSPPKEDNKQRIVTHVDVKYVSSMVTDTEIEVSSVDGGNEISMPEQNAPISLNASYYWMFYPISSGSRKSEIFENDNRYIIEQLTSDEGSTQYQEYLMEKATSTDYSELVSDTDANYMKVELSHGGTSTRTNFHDDALIGSFYSQSSKYFEIVGQDGGNIIDIFKKDISQTTALNPNGAPDYVLSQEFAWKGVEWYMTDEGNISNLRTKFFQGNIKSIDLTTKEVVIENITENTATKFGQGYFNLGTREEISFFDRFTTTYSHTITSNPRKVYEKFKGWYLCDNSGNKYPIKDVTIDPDRNDLDPYFVTIELTEEPTEFSKLETVYVLFDRSPLQKVGTFEGLHFVDVTELNLGALDVNVRICLDGYWLGPQFNIPIGSGSKINLCGGRYWGLLDRARDNNNAIVFMRTRKTIGLSSFYHTTSNEDFLLHYDYFLRTLAIRRGSIEFKEYPMNYEVSIGIPSKRSSATITSSTNTSIGLDSDEDRVKSLTINSPKGDEIMLFSVGSEKNYYGTVIAGKGDMSLIGFENTSVTQDSSLYEYNDQPVSPIYEYKVGKYSADQTKRVFMGVKTSDSPIIISTPSSTTIVSSVEVEYVNNNQTLNDVELFDIYQISDDELMVFMGRNFRPFKVTNKKTPVTKISNSTTDSTRWDNSSGIFVIGSKNTGTLWGNPIAKFRDNDDQYGLLIMESVEYCCSIYNDVANEIIILFLGRKDGALFLGVYIVSVPSLSYENFKCISEADDQDFIWRPPALEETPDSIYKKQIVDNYKYDPVTETTTDEIMVVASADSSIDPQIVVTNVTDFGVISTYQTSEGNMMAFYDSSDGVQMIFSKDSGRTWEGSKIVLARFGKSGYYSGGLLFYITDEGIYSKIITESLLSGAFNAVEGSSASDIELIQETFDDQIATSLETGPIPTQKLSAHTDQTGIFHVFYYDEGGRISSIEGTYLGWKTTNNF